jgi:hypothetical protein
MRYFYEVSGLLFASLFSLLLAAVFRCYFATAGFKSPGFLRPSEIMPLYFPGIISGISERSHTRSKSPRDGSRSAAAAKNALHQVMWVLTATLRHIHFRTLCASPWEACASRSSFVHNASQR